MEGVDLWSGWFLIVFRLFYAPHGHSLVCRVMADDPNGNVWIPPTEEDDGFFACGSLSNGFYSFDIITKQFETLTDMPRERYRHSSVVINDQVWVMGGRTLFDDLIPEADIYDIATGT